MNTELIKKIFDKSIYTYIILFLISIILVYVLSCLICNKNDKEHMINIKYDPNTSYNRNTCNFKMNKILHEQLKKNNINKSDKWSLYFPCSYDSIDKEILRMPVKEDAKYFIIDNADTITSKRSLWLNVVKLYGLQKAKTMMPNSYVLTLNEDIKRFEKEYNPNKIYIMKKNIQRQQGLKITKDKNEILNSPNKNYVIVQELLQNPYLISKRKTNMRFYVLVICNKEEINVYVYDDGFMYYTKEYFKENSISDDVNITTGYIDRQVYIDNPLTHKDLRSYLDDYNNRELLDIEEQLVLNNLSISETYFNRIYQLLHDVFISFYGKICKGKLSSCITFQLFGVDIAVDNELNPMVIEINKGPDMSAKDVRDSDLKNNVTSDMLILVGSKKADPNKQNGFIRILDINNGFMNKTDI